MLCCFVKSHAKVDDVFIHQSINSGQNFVNFSKNPGEIQCLLKNIFYDFKKQGDEIVVAEWKFLRNGKKRKQNQYVVNVNWLRSLMKHIWKKKIGHDIFIDGKLTYRWVDGKEEVQRSDDDGWPSVIDGAEKDDEGAVDDADNWDNRQNLQGNPQDNGTIGGRFLNFLGEILTFLRTPMICDAR
ncbi:MAG: hypothetical protein LBR92_02560 [Puniceicoccales bacterium]|nr:hypothetical protein [Puniceicoccales bacterium]